MDNFSWLSSVIIPAAVSLISSTLAYIIGIRKEQNTYINTQIGEIEQRLDAIYHKASLFYQVDFSDENYHYMVYEADSIKTLLSRINTDLAIFQYSIFYRILTDHIFHQKESDTLVQLSSQIQVIKSNLKRKHF